MSAKGTQGSAPQQSHLQPNNNSGYFQNAQSTSQSHTPSSVPARSPYTESQSFMPSTQVADPAQTQSQTQTPMQSVTQASPLGASVPYRSRDNYDSYNGVDTAASVNHDFAAQNQQQTQQPFTGRFAENWDASQRGSSILDGADAVGSGGGSLSDSTNAQPSRSNTLKKKASLRRGNSLHRSSSRRSMKAGSVRSLALRSDHGADADDEAQFQSAFYCPVPTRSAPTEMLVNRFTAWRKILKDLIAYHREVQSHYEARAKSLQKLAAALNSTSSSSGTGVPTGFIASGGLGDATGILRNFHKQAVAEAVKAREVEEDVILSLTGLRSDLSQKIKEIKNIAGDFRNNVEKEMEATKRAVKTLQDHLGQAELDTATTTGRQDPYLLRLIADRQLDRQIAEENYLHSAFLNLERSGRELESIVVGEVQKSYNAYVGGILRRETVLIGSVTDELRAGPLAMPKDEEWDAFIYSNSGSFVGPNVPLRSSQFLTYPGQDHAACQELRAGLLERKTKYLKSYTAGWYVLSPTHLHEFKSADKLGAPIMSLYLPEQKLGPHSAPGASSNKFALKGRQTGGLHRGHTWYFRAESHDTMMAWYEAIQAVTEQVGSSISAGAAIGGVSRSASRASQMTSLTSVSRNGNANANTNGLLHGRSTSRASQHTYSSDGVVNEDDDEPFAANSPAALAGLPQQQQAQQQYQQYQQQPQQYQQYQQQQQHQQYQQYQPETYAAVNDARAISPEHLQGQEPQIPIVAQMQTPAPQPLTPQTPQTLSSQNQSDITVVPIPAVQQARPTQAGRFPSDLQVNAQRGLEVQAAGIPVSPTSVTGSGSPGSQSIQGQVQGQPAYASSDYNVIAAAAALPGQYGDSQVKTEAPASVVPVAAVAHVAPVAAVETQTETHTEGTQTEPVGAVNTADTANINGVSTESEERPELKTRQASEAFTISNLHIPGEYPGK